MRMQCLFIAIVITQTKPSEDNEVLLVCTRMVWVTSHTCLFTIYIVGLKLSSAVLVGGFRAPKKQHSIFFQRAQNYMFGDFFFLILSLQEKDIYADAAVCSWQFNLQSCLKYCYSHIMHIMQRVFNFPVGFKLECSTFQWSPRITRILNVLKRAHWTLGYFYCANMVKENIIMGLIFIPNTPQRI